jgi:DNA-binding transcriptional LysR family regulator
MDKLTRMQAFAQVVAHGGFAAAARELSLSRSAVSKYVQDLERELGVQLLRRTTRVVSPTEVGRAYYERAKIILADVAEAEEAVSQLHSQPRGLLRVNAPMSFGTLHLGHAIADFMRANTEVTVHLALNDRFVDPIEEGHDVTIRIAQLPDSSLIARKIAPARLVLCASPSYLKAHKEPRKPQDLTVHECLHYGLASSGAQWKLTGANGVESVSISYRLCSNNGEILRDAALKGIGIALLPTFIVGRDLQSGQLRTVLSRFAPPPLAISALYAPSRHLTAKVRLFVDFLAKRFGDRPQWDLVE